MKLSYILAKRFVAGETLEETLPVVEELNAKGLFVTLDLLGEYVKDQAVAETATQEYIRLLQVMADRRRQGRLGDSTISIKLSMIGQNIGHDFCRDNLCRLLDAAKQQDVFVRLDMEGSDLTESTLLLFEDVYPQYPDHVGPVLQAYLRRTEQDVGRMCELNARVRLCKGAYKEPPEIAYQDMPTIQDKFIQYMKLLITEARYPGIATHDDLIIDATRQFAEERGISREAFEFQMLYGIRPRKQVELVQAGYRMRIYVPYGTQWFPYFSRRLRERKENVWFVVKNLFKG